MKTIFSVMALITMTSTAVADPTFQRWVNDQRLCTTQGLIEADDSHKWIETSEKTFSIYGWEEGCEGVIRFSEGGTTFGTAFCFQEDFEVGVDLMMTNIISETLLVEYQHTWGPETYQLCQNNG